MNRTPTPAPERAESNVAAPNHASLAAATASPAARARARGWALVVLVFAGGMDTFLAIPAFNGLLRGEPWQSWICAIAFALISVSSAYAAGVLYKQSKRRLSFVALVASVVMVIALCILRVQAASINSSSTGYEGGAALHDEAAAELGIAFVLALAMLALIGLAWIDGFKITLAPAEELFRELEQKLAAANTEVAGLEGEHVRLNENQTIAELRLQHLPDERKEALLGLQSFADELRELNRTEIVIHLGNPTATSGLDLPLTDTEETSNTSSPNEGNQP
ncbi:hypothetical protein [uncultured Microbacterium sp.]|uniref:hypothetical protein n=1 Tax=uncultured Microbacterium sp. TaxID=191216 RepID=UPI0028D0AED4|nr:hypothetical protein [uncultured Microbacterium sp.]